MSNLENEILLENFFEEFLEEGFSESEAKKMAHIKLKKNDQIGEDDVY